ncbi:DUF87 domain-containing protein [Candidatus Micrarchaeota archaeon]|nr:DUF87 domain-containing protein [Candidatus Micrarchaeota archaeon]
MLALSPKKPAAIGSLYGSDFPLEIDLASLQGVTLVTGRKGSGKSHLAKKLLEQIIANGAPAVVLDVNGEYASLKKNTSGGESGVCEEIFELAPGSNFFIPLDGISFETFCKMCQIEENHNSFRLFARYWSENDTGKDLGNLREWVQSSQSPPGSLNAAMARIDYASSLGVFGEFNFAAKLEGVRNGGAIVLNLFKQGEKAKELSIVYVLRQLIEAGLQDRGRVFLFAEEAQNTSKRNFGTTLLPECATWESIPSSSPTSQQPCQAWCSASATTCSPSISPPTTTLPSSPTRRL